MFRQIVDRRIPIDVNVLCHLAEFLAGSVILARVKFNLHNVVLPRGWILALLRQMVMRKPDTMLLDRLLSSMGALLENLVWGGEEASTFIIQLLSKMWSLRRTRRPGHLLFESRSIADKPALRALFIYRM